MIFYSLLPLNQSIQTKYPMSLLLELEIEFVALLIDLFLSAYWNSDWFAGYYPFWWSPVGYSFRDRVLLLICELKKSLKFSIFLWYELSPAHHKYRACELSFCFVSHFNPNSDYYLAITDPFILIISSSRYQLLN